MTFGAIFLTIPPNLKEIQSALPLLEQKNALRNVYGNLQAAAVRSPVTEGAVG